MGEMKLNLLTEASKRAKNATFSFGHEEENMQGISIYPRQFDTKWGRNISLPGLFMK
jgi:hypothetical protein